MTLDAVVRRYRTLSDEDARQVFPDLEQLHGDWGMLYIEGQDGHWTLLGDYDFCRLLEQVGTTMEAPDGDVEQLVPWGGRRIPEPRLEEFAFEEFRPEWLIRGWPDEWDRLGRVEVYDCPPVDLRLPLVTAGACPAWLIAGAEFQRICRNAIDSRGVAPREEYVAAHGGQHHLAVGARWIGKGLGKRAIVMAFRCEASSLTKLAQAADGTKGPIVSALELAPPRDDDCLDFDRGVIIEATPADLDNASPAFVREPWFLALVSARVDNRFA